jgi:hypothetical protein
VSLLPDHEIVVVIANIGKRLIAHDPANCFDLGCTRQINLAVRGEDRIEQAEMTRGRGGQLAISSGGQND